MEDGRGRGNVRGWVRLSGDIEAGGQVCRGWAESTIGKGKVGDRDETERGYSCCCARGDDAGDEMKASKERWRSCAGKEVSSVDGQGESNVGKRR